METHIDLTRHQHTWSAECLPPKKIDVRGGPPNVCVIEVKSKAHNQHGAIALIFLTDRKCF